jgi:hypothetical protein
MKERRLDGYRDLDCGVSAFARGGAVGRKGGHGGQGERRLKGRRRRRRNKQQEGGTICSPPAHGPGASVSDHGAQVTLACFLALCSFFNLKPDNSTFKHL